jgi:hypothetical protein
MTAGAASASSSSAAVRAGPGRSRSRSGAATSRNGSRPAPPTAPARSASQQRRTTVTASRPQDVGHARVPSSQRSRSRSRPRSVSAHSVSVSRTASVSSLDSRSDAEPASLSLSLPSSRQRSAPSSVSSDFGGDGFVGAAAVTQRRHGGSHRVDEHHGRWLRGGAADVHAPVRHPASGSTARGERVIHVVHSVDMSSGSVSSTYEASVPRRDSTASVDTRGRVSAPRGGPLARAAVHTVENRVPQTAVKQGHRDEPVWRDVSRGTGRAGTTPSLAAAAEAAGGISREHVMHEPARVLVAAPATPLAAAHKPRRAWEVPPDAADARVRLCAVPRV